MTLFDELDLKLTFNTHCRTCRLNIFVKRYCKSRIFYHGFRHVVWSLLEWLVASRFQLKPFDIIALQVCNWLSVFFFILKIGVIIEFGSFNVLIRHLFGCAMSAISVSFWSMFLYTFPRCAFNPFPFYQFNLKALFVIKRLKVISSFECTKSYKFE